MYYKVIKNDDNSVVDAINSLHYVRRNPRNGMILSCTEKSGQGVLSYDSSVIYQLPYKDSLGDGYDVITLVEIDEAEFNEIRALIDSMKPEPEEPDDDEFPEEEHPEPPKPIDPTQPMTPWEEMQYKVSMLEEQLAATKILLGVE